VVKIAINTKIKLTLKIFLTENTAIALLVDKIVR